MNSHSEQHPIADQYLVSIFKSLKRAEMYLYVVKSQGLNNVPAELKEIFGEPIPVFDLLLTRDKKLARADAKEVMSKLHQTGFYLQMPPPEEKIPELVRVSEEMPAMGRHDQE